MLVSVLSIWGQDTVFTLESANDEITKFQDAQSIIVNQAKDASEINTVDKAQADSILTDTFHKLGKVMSVYKQIEQDPQLIKEAQQVIVGFITDYKKAIFDDNGENIKVTTRSFINVAENYSPKFDGFYSKAQEYIETHPSASNVNNHDADDESVSVDGNENGLESQSNRTVSDTIKNDSVSSLLAWIALAIGLLSLLLSVLALVRINKEHYRISKRKQEIEDAERRINQKISEIKPSSFRGTTSSYVPPIHQPQYQPKQQHRKGQTSIFPVRPEDNISRVKVDERPTTSYLYATIKAQSPYAEFFKVTNENTGDKVFMLILASPEADLADFTIAPNMSPDFRKSVIIDRDTYLPSLFCEKSIDSSNPTRIEVSSAGRAKKVDGKWQVQDRMVIRIV